MFKFSKLTDYCFFSKGEFAAGEMYTSEGEGEGDFSYLDLVDDDDHLADQNLLDIKDYR